MRIGVVALNEDEPIIIAEYRGRSIPPIGGLLTLRLEDPEQEKPGQSKYGLGSFRIKDVEILADNRYDAIPGMVVSAEKDPEEDIELTVEPVDETAKKYVEAVFEMGG